VLVFFNIRSIHNVGSIFRTADAAGVSKIILSGYTPTPLDRFGRARSDLAKVALGAEKTIPWESAATLMPVLKRLKKEGFTLLAIEQSPKATPLFEWHPPSPSQPIALVLGNEVRGLSSQALQAADAILEIPMRGKKESLNVSVAAGIALFAVMK